MTACLGWYPQLSTTDGSSLSAISCPTASVCFAAGSDSSGNAVVEQTTDAGGQWVQDTNGVTGLGLNAISCADADHCVAVGGVSLGGIIGPSNAVLVTTDGGASWDASTVSSVAGYLTSVSCADAEHCWATAAVGIVGASTVIATTDGATSWTTLPWSAPPLSAGRGGPMTSQLNAITCTTDSDCLAVGQATYQTTLSPPMENEGVVSTTDDGGQSWQSQLITANDITGISCASADTCVAVGQDTVVSEQDNLFSAYGLTTTDGAATWSVSTLSGGTELAGGNAPSLNAVSCFDTEHCVAVGVVTDTNEYETAVIGTADGGTTWSDQATSVPTGSPLEGVACVSASTCWAVGFTTTGSVVIHTINDGVAWPSVSGVSPDQSSFGGGVPVTVTGAGFQVGTPTVLFGSVAATDVQVVSGSEITAVVPPSAFPGEASTADVTVTNPLGTSPVTPNDAYSYEAPVRATRSRRRHPPWGT